MGQVKLKLDVFVRIFRPFRLGRSPDFDCTVVGGGGQQACDCRVKVDAGHRFVVSFELDERRFPLPMVHVNRGVLRAGCDKFLVLPTKAGMNEEKALLVTPEAANQRVAFYIPQMEPLVLHIE